MLISVDMFLYATNNAIIECREHFKMQCFNLYCWLFNKSVSTLISFPILSYISCANACVKTY